MTKHQKHTALIRRKSNNYAINEIAILGVKCTIIDDLCQKIAKKLQKTAKIAYLDASHAKDSEVPFIDTYTFHDLGRLAAKQHLILDRYTSKIQFSQYDLLFINGNHYQGKQQVLVLDKEKQASVLKRLDQLTNIKFVIKATRDAKYFAFLLEKFPKIKEMQCYDIEDINGISSHIDQIIQENIPKINGLVLAGGKSKRMQKDKTQLRYFEKPQVEHVQELLENQEIKTFISVQKSTSENQISDSFFGLGPFGAICSAFRENPNVAWLVLATDLPFLDDALLKTLLEKRDPSKIATAIKGKNKSFMEPLITIYEPKAYPIFLQFLAQGHACPRKALINSQVKIIEVDDDLIRNVNTPEEYHAAQNEING